jgi:4'-phosphopantetheinyl transferase EntD
MSSPRILETWRELLPRGVEISAGPLLDNPPELTPREEKSAGVMAPRRTLEFKTGRAYAKLALSKLGFSNVELAVGANRAPIWPAGTSGSITHAAGHVAAAVANVASVGMIGIDAEANCASPPSIWAQFLTARELQHVRGLPLAARAGLVLSIWCVKEAVSKALGYPIDPTEIEVWHENTLSETVDLWRSTIRGTRSYPGNVEARTARLRKFVLGVAIVQPSE